MKTTTIKKVKVVREACKDFGYRTKYLSFNRQVHVLTEGERVVILDALDDSELANLSRNCFNLLKNKGYVNEHL